MAGVQEICDRTASATGRSLGALAADRFGRSGRIVIFVLLVALLVANGLNIAADLVAVGAGMNLFHAGPIALLAALAGAAVTVLLATGSFDTIARVFKVLCVGLLAYLVELFIVHADWHQVALHTFVPHLKVSSAYIALLVAMLGTTISPYLFFWESIHRVEEMRDEPEGGAKPVPLEQMTPTKAMRKLSTRRFDVFTGMAFSNAVMFAIIVGTASTLYAHGKHNVTSPAQAASALQPVAGRFASYIFALGFIGAGMLAVPVLAGAASAGLAGLLGKQAGFSRSPREAPLFYALVAFGTVGGTALSLFGLNPIKLLVFVAVVNGAAAAPFLVVVMLISGDKRIMQKYVNGRLASIVGWTTVVIMTAAAIGLAASA